MKKCLLLFLLSATIATAAHASKTILPDACGADKIKFDVETKKDQPAPPQPAEGKAQVVFLSTVTNIGYIFGGPSYTTRFGLDGKWVGAANNNSYFVLDIDPGKHHLCSSVQGFGNAPKDKIGMTSFTAEAGKVYYVAYVVKNKQSTTFVGAGGGGSFGGGGAGGGGGGGGAAHHVDASEGLVLLDEDDGQYRVKASKVSVSTVKKDEDSSSDR